MRLNPKERDAIAQAARESFSPGTAVFLFGSRTDDARRGGDIDLLVETPQLLNPSEQVHWRTRFVARIWRELDEQRIDVVIAANDEPDQRPVVAAARRTGILLTKV
jgi:predicted nucleotidyltransferase